MKRLSLACCALAATCVFATVALAPPVPKPKGHFGGGWDKPIDPTELCKFTFTPESLTIKVPGGEYDLYPGERNRPQNAPRLLRSVKGDFAAQVRVCALFPLNDPGKGRDVSGEIGAGLLVLQDKDKPRAAYRATFGGYYFFEKGVGVGVGPRGRALNIGIDNPHSPRQPLKSDHPTVKACAKGGKSMQAHLKVERRGTVMEAYLSADGKKWTHFPKQYPKDPNNEIHGDVKVGVVVFYSWADPIEVTFDQWKLTPLKAK